MIHIVTSYKPEGVEVSADIFGQYAVHKTPGYNVETWAVTHVLSGLAVIASIISYGDACNLASRLENRIDCDAYWLAGRCADDAFYEQVNLIVKAWSAHCGQIFDYTLSGARCEVQP